MSETTNGIHRLGDKHYMNQYVAICRNCGGLGGFGRQFDSGRRTWDTCPVCQGSGRVLISKEIIVNIKPYNSNL